jgi:hypothetical protein
MSDSLEDGSRVVGSSFDDSTENQGLGYSHSDRNLPKTLDYLIVLCMLSTVYDAAQ